MTKSIQIINTAKNAASPTVKSAIAIELKPEETNRKSYFKNPHYFFLLFSTLHLPLLR